MEYIVCIGTDRFITLGVCVSRVSFPYFKEMHYWILIHKMFSIVEYKGERTKVLQTLDVVLEGGGEGVEGMDFPFSYQEYK